ncbi:MFS transporter [Halanaerobium congolense]|uniref:MFS transporter n=1 Tax=Halanaerobium congolense TaxID=54121 RepID=UPI00115FFDA9|nr:MFS transporter [Halanaerobium congolense]
MLKLENQNKLQYKFLIIISTAYLAVDINIQGFLALMPFIREEFALNSSTAGLYSTFHYLLATIVAVFSGQIVDKIGSKKGLVVGTTVLGLLMFFQARSPSFSLILLLALVSGLFFSIITPSLNKAVMLKTTPENRATSMGVMQMGGGIGGFTGAILLPFLAEKIGWRNAVSLSALIAVLVGIFIYIFFKEENNKRTEENIKQRQNQPAFKESLFKLFQNKNLLLVCFFGLILGFNSGSVPTHYTLYLTQDAAMSRTAAGFAFGLLQIGGIIGRPLLGFLNDKFLNGSRTKGLVFVGLSLTAVNIYYAYVISVFEMSIYLIYLSSLILGFLTLGWMGLYFTAVIELASEKLTGIGTGLSLVFIRFGVLLSPPLFGLLADLNSSYQMSWFALSILTLFCTLLFAYFFKDKFAEI